jgi:hypothetical protein
VLFDNTYRKRPDGRVQLVPMKGSPLFSASTGADAP